MNAIDTVKTIMKEKGLSQEQVGTKAGYANGQVGVSAIINRGKKDMNVSNLAKLAEAMGCELVVRDKNSDREWIVTKEKKEV